MPPLRRGACEYMATASAPRTAVGDSEAVDRPKWQRVKLGADGQLTKKDLAASKPVQILQSPCSD